MIDHRRHAPIARCRPVTGGQRPGKTPALYRGAKARGLRDMYGTDHAEPQREGRFRWLMSTCLAAAVGGVSILVVVFGAADKQETEDGLMPALQRLREGTVAPPLEALLRRDDGLKWSVPKVDRLQVTSGSKSTRFIIHDTQRERRGGREYIYAKPYVRIVARLAPVPANATDAIPAFNPFKLYANNKPIGDEADDDAESVEKGDVSIRVVDLLGGVLPAEDSQSIDDDEVAEIIARFESAETLIADSALPGLGEEEIGADDVPDRTPAASAEAADPNTTVLAKVGHDEDGSSELDVLRPTVKTVRQGQRLNQVLAEAGATSWQIREMIEAMKPVFPEKSVEAGQEVHIALQPSLTAENRMEPVRFSIFGEGHVHKVTVSRNNAGEFVASTTPMDDESLLRLASFGESGAPQTSSLYASLYHASLTESIPDETITQILQVHAYETDFRRRLRSGDTCELFFDLKDEGGTDGPPGELLYTAITTGGETRRYYRFRTPDGEVDYYDVHGNNAKRFLMRRPVRGDDVRLTSGFGFRRHPLLGETRMHTGIDWAAPPNTPILAAGDGVIEEAGRKGYNGNYIRIRHANGYQTAYSHMSRFAPGANPGVRVRQGQVIGYVGSTGLSSGPHLHFEILVNNQFVNPLSIEVPRERQLAGRDLAEFRKERMRIDELMRRTPVLTASK